MLNIIYSFFFPNLFLKDFSCHNNLFSTRSGNLTHYLEIVLSTINGFVTEFFVLLHFSFAKYFGIKKLI